LRINRAQKEIRWICASREWPRGQRCRGFDQRKFEPEKKKEVEEKRENLKNKSHFLVTSAISRNVTITPMGRVSNDEKRAGNDSG